MTISKMEFNALCKLEPYSRYMYFIKKFADMGIMYSLVNEKNKFAIAEVSNKMLISFWPAKDFAITLATGKWVKYSEYEISLDSFNEKVIPEIKQNGYLINIFPLFDKSGFVVDVEEFVRDLNTELNNY